MNTNESQWQLATMTQDTMDAVEAWLSASNFAETTRRTYRNYIRYLSDWAGNRAVADLSATDYRKFCLDRAWGPSTMHSVLQCIRSFLHWCNQEDAPLMRMHIPKPRQRPHRTASPEDIDQLCAACSRTKAGRQEAIILRLMWDAWLRVHEVPQLRLDGLDTERRLLLVHGKGDHWDYVPLTIEMVSTLEAWIREERPKFAKAKTIFCNTFTGQPLTTDGLKKNLQRLSHRAGVKFSPHDARRGAATDSLRRGMPTRLAQIKGRWSSIALVEVYTAELGVEDVRAWMDRTPGGAS